MYFNKHRTSNLNKAINNKPKICVPRVKTLIITKTVNGTNRNEFNADIPSVGKNGNEENRNVNPSVGENINEDEVTKSVEEIINDLKLTESEKTKGIINYLEYYQETTKKTEYIKGTKTDIFTHYEPGANFSEVENAQNNLIEELNATTEEEIIEEAIQKIKQKKAENQNNTQNLMSFGNSQDNQNNTQDNGFKKLDSSTFFNTLEKFCTAFNEETSNNKNETCGRGKK